MFYILLRIIAECRSICWIIGRGPEKDVAIVTGRGKQFTCRDLVVFDVGGEDIAYREDTTALH